MLATKLYLRPQFCAHYYLKLDHIRQNVHWNLYVIHFYSQLSNQMIVCRFLVLLLWTHLWNWNRLPLFIQSVVDTEDPHTRKFTRSILTFKAPNRLIITVLCLSLFSWPCDLRLTFVPSCVSFRYTEEEIRQKVSTFRQMLMDKEGVITREGSHTQPV